MEYKNFEEVFLTEQEIKLLSEIGGGILTRSYVPEHLLSLGFLENYRNDKEKFIITPKGNRYLEFIKQKNLKELKEQRIISRRYWLSLIITNIISLAALIVSIIALSSTPQ